VSDNNTSDICGPFDVQSINHKLYFVSFIDDFSRYAHVYFLRSKDETFEKYKEFIAGSPHRMRTRILRSDNGGEYISGRMAQFLQDQGTIHQPSPAYTPEFNGVAERFNGVIIDMVRAMLADSSLPRSFWTEAVSFAVYMNNRSPTKANAGKTPLELWTGGTLPRLGHLHVFGSAAYLLDTGTHTKKLDSRTKDVIYVGPTSDPSQHRLYVPSSKTFTISRNVKFPHDDAPVPGSPIMPLPGFVQETEPVMQQLDDVVQGVNVSAPLTHRLRSSLR
jgi:transposase InsO family protein